MEHDGCLPFTWEKAVSSGFGFRAVKLRPGIRRLPFIQISSIYRKTAANTWNCNERWLWRNRTRISVSLCGTFPGQKTGLPFRIFLTWDQAPHWGKKDKKLASEASWLQTTAGIALLADICPVCPGFFPFTPPGVLSQARDVSLFPYGKFSTSTTQKVGFHFTPQEGFSGNLL